jgi:hypothetical protein
MNATRCFPSTHHISSLSQTYLYSQQLEFSEFGDREGASTGRAGCSADATCDNTGLFYKV